MSTPLLMRLALIVGSVSDAAVCTAWRNTTSESSLRYGTEMAPQELPEFHECGRTGHAVEEEVDDVGGRRRFAGEHRMGERQRERAEHAGGFERLAAQVVAWR